MSQEAKNKYLKEKVDSFQVRVPKGKKEELKEFAKQQGKSLNSFINEIINNAINKKADMQITAEEQTN